MRKGGEYIGKRYGKKRRKGRKFEMFSLNDDNVT